MSKRITCVALFAPEDLAKIESLVSVAGENNKVPCFVEGRENLDTLPRHSTLIAWDASLKEEIIKAFRTIKTGDMALEVSSVKLNQAKDKSYVLKFIVNWNENLKQVQKALYNLLPNERFEPNAYETHITIHADWDYEKILKMQALINANFEPFTMKVDEIGIFEIYPAESIL